MEYFLLSKFEVQKEDKKIVMYDVGFREVGRF